MPWRLHHLLDQTGHAAFELDGRGNLIWLNEKAKSYIGTAFLISGRRLQALNPCSDRQLQTLVQDLQQPLALACPTPGFISIERANARPLIAHAIFLDSKDQAHLRGALILVIDPEQERAPAQSMLQAVFRLTPAEARLAIGIARGRDLEAIANELGITVATIRTQLKAVFAKTNTSRQSELAVLLARTAQAID
jgi:DNA-binding CsgD family transcriptional regulator